MKRESTKTIFKRAATKFEFSGDDSTFFLKMNDKYLIVNLQKSSSGKSFYINCGISFIELLCDEELQHSPTTTFENKANRFPAHVDFRVESIPHTTIKQDQIDSASTNQNTQEIEKILQAALQSVISFTQQHGSREEIRRLSQAEKFNAIINKEV